MRMLASRALNHLFSVYYSDPPALSSPISLQTFIKKSTAAYSHWLLLNPVLAGLLRIRSAS